MLVGFEQGDFRRPVVLGGLFNGVDTVPTGPADLVDGGSGAVNRRSLVSRRGHRIDLLDADGKTEGVRLATTGDKLADQPGPHRDPDHRARRRQGADRGHPGRHHRLGRVGDGAEGRLDLAQGHRRGDRWTAAGGAVSVKSGSQLTLDGGGMATLKAGMVKIN